MKKLIEKNNCGFYLLIITLIAISILGCNSGELTRSEAQSKIEKTKEFKSISTLDLITNEENMKDRHFINKASDSETKEEGMKRSFESILYRNADIAVVNHLGLVSIKQKFIREQKRFMGIDPNWKIAVTIRNNEKGKALWGKTNMPKGIKVDKSTELPLAMKEFGEVIGITKQGETTAIVNFTYRWIPNELGKHFDSSEKEFQGLPDKIKKTLQGVRADGIQNKTIPWKDKRSGQAIFQKFDDVWKLEIVRMK